MKVLLIRPTPRTKCAGVDGYCRALQDLFAHDSEVEILPIDDYEVIRSRLFNDFYKWKPFLDKIKKSGADVVHINGYTSFSTLEAFIAAKRCKKKIVYTAHWHPYFTLRRPLLGWLFFNILLKPLVKNWVGAVVTINNEDTAYFQKFHKNVHCIQHWMRFEKPILHVENNMGKKMVLFVGRINDPNKGIEHLYSLPEGKYEIHCVGKGIMKPRVDMIQHINISVDELKNLYSKASVVVVPSKYEAFSYVSLEALASNVPICVSDRVRIVDWLDGLEWGRVFPFHDYVGFCCAVEKTIGTPVDREQILLRFAPQYKKYYRLYLDVVKSKL